MVTIFALKKYMIEQLKAHIPTVAFNGNSEDLEKSLTELQRYETKIISFIKKNDRIEELTLLSYLEKKNIKLSPFSSHGNRI